MAVVYAVHSGVPGRTRFKVAGLYLSGPLQEWIESGLRRVKKVFKASASKTTGNVLVHYESDLEESVLEQILKDLVEKFESASRSNPEASISTGRHPDDHSALRLAEPESFSGFHWPESIKSQMQRLRLWPADPPQGPWPLMERQAVLETLDTDPETGLSLPEAAERLRLYGANTLSEAGLRSKWSIFFDQFKSLPVALLGAAAGVSLCTGGIIDAAIIFGVVAANAVIGYITESGAEKTINSLRDKLDPETQVIREGKTMEIPAEGLVVGDIMVLKPGVYVSADCRLLIAGNITLDESLLTGESMPVSKTSAPLREPQNSLAEQNNMVFMGTLVTGGQGLAVVVATGAGSELGKLQAMLDQTQSPKTPIEKQLARVGDQLVLMCLAICGAVFLIGFLRGQGFLSMLRTSIALAAAAVPEGLPAAATTTFALGIKRMREDKVLIRNLEAVETLGSVQVICLDKTGTITHNRMSVTKFYAGGREIDFKNGTFLLNGREVESLRPDLRSLIRTSVLCNESCIDGGDRQNGWVLNGSPTENALIEMALASGLEVEGIRGKYQQTGINHRAENRLFMTTLHTRKNGGRMLAVKGSPEKVLEMCTSQKAGGQRVSLAETDRNDILRANQKMADQAMRVLGVAYAKYTPPEEPRGEQNLTWLGLIGMADPIRDGVRELIADFHRAGIETVMITGDQKATAYAVARELGLSRNGGLGVVDVSELSGENDGEFLKHSGKAQVYSRVSPAQKLSVVQELQRAGLVVAMTGDGVNDSPALKAAEVGIAMGRGGTDVARDVADVVLEEDDLEKLVIALRDGRTTHNNIKKSVHFFLSTNMSEIMVMSTALVFGLGAPLTTMQLLWINLISDIFPGLALSLEYPEPDVLDQPPRDPTAPLFSSRDYKRMVWESSVISASSLAAYGYGLARYGFGVRAASLAFNSLTISQLLHAVSCRSPHGTWFGKNRLKPNKYLNWALGGSLALQITAMFVPTLRSLLGLAVPTLADTAVLAGASLLPLAVNELTKPGALPKNTPQNLEEQQATAA